MMTMFHSLGPTMAARKIAKVRAGSASQASVMRMITWSTQPPKKPERIPSAVPITPAKITAVKPTIIDTRVPKISRESTSRPMWSVPSQCSALPPATQAGGLKRWESEPTSGLCGAMNSANTAVNTSTSRIRIGNVGKPSVRKAARREANGSPAAGLGAAVLTLIANPRVDDAVEDVDHQADDDDHRAIHQDRGLHHGKVAEGDALVDQPADARPR